MEILRGILAQNPADRLALYGLAMECVKAGQLEDGVAQFEALLKVDPNYCYAYFHGAQTLERLGRIEDARNWYARGIESANRIGDQHARSELQSALDLLG